MSKLSQTEREDLYREKARNDAERGDFNPPGLSLGEKLGLTFVTCGLGAAAFLDNTQGLRGRTRQGRRAQLDPARLKV